MQLATLPPIWFDLPVGTLLWRIYARGGTYPTTWNAFRTFGPLDARFDHHTHPKREQERGIMYLGRRGLTCFAEVFQRERIIDVHNGDPFLVAFRLSEPVRLLDLSGHWPTTVGASMAINSGSRRRAKVWSRAIYAAYPEAQGIWYCSAMDANQPCVALYERGQHALPPVSSFHAALADPRLRLFVDRVATLLNYDVIPPRR